jgi:adenylate cyclase
LIALAQARQVDAQAYEAYLKGNFFKDKMTPLDLERSVEFFARATDFDPTYARAYRELARTISISEFSGWVRREKSSRRRGANAAKALEVDETVASAHIALVRDARFL